MRSYNLEELSVLVLEKHLLIRKLLTDVFKELGVPTVHSTPDPDMAWDLFKQLPIDLILCDWTPDLDGMAFLTQIRQHEDSPNSFIPVLVCTANTEYQHVCTARDNGMTEFLAKPVSAKTIYSRICAVVENHRPFIRIPDFFGPDRRRHLIGDHGGEDRRRHAI